MRPQEKEAQAQTSSWTSIILRRFFRHKMALWGISVMSLLILSMIFAPYITSYDPEEIDLESLLAPPSMQHLLGTDELGRDLLARLLYGGRVSLLIGVMAMAIAITIGTLLGAMAGYWGGIVDVLLMRGTDFFLAFPRIFVLILLSTLLGPNLPTIVLVIGALSWMGVSRLVRAAFLALREQQFVEAAAAIGAQNFRVIYRHILPNALSPIIVAATLGVADAIIAESGLSFLGLGIQPPTATWGNMLRNALDQMFDAPWTGIFPGLMIFLSVLSINYIGDGLRDALDPRWIERKE
jgi:peptide/nickel transport system permease protein